MDDNSKEILEQLKEIFENVNNWLNFAEAKNGALVAFDIAIIGTILGTDYFKNYTSILIILVVGFSISLVVALISFIPNLNKFINNFSRSSQPKDDDNLIFFGDIQKYTAITYVQKLYKNYINIDIDEKDIKKLVFDYASEIIENSKICILKYKLFKFSIWSAILTVIIFVISCIVA